MLVYRLIVRTVLEFIHDECQRIAAALAFYTVLSLPAILFFLIATAGLVFDPHDVRGEIAEQTERLWGDSGAEMLRTIIAHAEQPGQGTNSWLIGIALILFGATGAVAELQSAMNVVWNVHPTAGRGGFLGFLVNRLLSLALLLVAAALLIASLVVDAFLAASTSWLAPHLPVAIPAESYALLNLGVSLLCLAILFAVIFKWFPETRVAWDDVAVGAIVTAIFFVAGKSAIGYYLGNSAVATPFGAAGALVAILIWIYYSMLVLLAGAEFTQAWSRRADAAWLRGETSDKSPVAR